MNAKEFLSRLQKHTENFSSVVATKEGDWIVKGFIDISQRIYTISVDTKIISKALELLLFPALQEFANNNDFLIELSPQQNFYPDLTFIHKKSGKKFAVDIKSTYRANESSVNGMTLGAFTGYFRNRDSTKNTRYPYGQYTAHIVLGVIYSKSEENIDERKQYKLTDLEEIASVIKNFDFFAQPKFCIASTRPGSGNTKNIGSVTKIDDLISGRGPFSMLGEEVYDDYWMYYLTEDMAKAMEITRPYTDLKTYLAYKNRGIEILRSHEQEIASIADDADDKGNE